MFSAKLAADALIIFGYILAMSKYKALVPLRRHYTAELDVRRCCTDQMASYHSPLQSGDYEVHILYCNVWKRRTLWWQQPFPSVFLAI